MRSPGGKRALPQGEGGAEGGLSPYSSQQPVIDTCPGWGPLLWAGPRQGALEAHSWESPRAPSSRAASPKPSHLSLGAPSPLHSQPGPPRPGAGEGSPLSQYSNPTWSQGCKLRTLRNLGAFGLSAWNVPPCALPPPGLSEGSGAGGQQQGGFQSGWHYAHGLRAPRDSWVGALQTRVSLTPLTPGLIITTSLPPQSSGQ